MLKFVDIPCVLACGIAHLRLACNTSRRERLRPIIGMGAGWVGSNADLTAHCSVRPASDTRPWYVLHADAYSYEVLQTIAVRSTTGQGRDSAHGFSARRAGYDHAGPDIFLRAGSPDVGHGWPTRRSAKPCSVSPESNSLRSGRCSSGQGTGRGTRENKWRAF